MECSKCGKELKNGATICSHCGMRVASIKEKIQVSYENEDLYIEPPVITESHTFVDEGEFLKKVEKLEKKQKRRKKKVAKKEIKTEKKNDKAKKKAKKKEKRREMSMEFLEKPILTIQKKVPIWVSIFLLMFAIGVVSGFIIFPNVFRSGSSSLKKEKEPAFSSESWVSDEFLLDGKFYKLNSSYSNFLENGWTFDLKKYGYDSSYILNKGEKVTTNIDLESIKFVDANIQVGFVNLSNAPKEIQDCEIWSFSIDNHTSSTPVKVMLPGGIQIGSNENEIFAIYGELDEKQIYRSDEAHYTTYHYTNGHTQYLDLTVYDQGGLQQINFRHY